MTAMQITRTAYIGVLAWTLAALFFRGAHRRFPLFWLYLALCLGASVSYATSVDFQSRAWWLSHWLPWQPVLLIGFLGALVELLVWTSAKLHSHEVGRLLAFLISIALAGVLLSLRLPSDVTLIQGVAECRRYIDLAACICLLAAGGYYWIRPFDLWPAVRRHAVVMTAYVTVQAILGLLTQALPDQWATLDLLGYLFSGACLLIWAFSAQIGSDRVPA